ncbi:hypothetical protein [Enterococcus pallens]|uniref:Uncharacterized protein n=1 Tax=Enterococcus pallens ATCC BAA-351 TaxID=1158607 RepID=R2PPA9_9ENTE|nr:hypothetical protein [Enterococcus pallens]EOH86347.1 hypothetical protein UAU_05269 [Enterococcus pallens ATCC BAA-351]EOU09432.1 hypothetical protein I588_05165 [Enterococcus pallens ATCC BAA-351]OJG77570.1 hypothetical protein RV10_GL002404 [Enterococcus pallens]
MNFKAEKAELVSTLQRLYLRNGLKDGFTKVVEPIDITAISSVFIAKRPTSEVPSKLRSVPIAKLISGEEIILLSPSLPLLLNKTEQEEKADAEAVVSAVIRLIEISKAAAAGDAYHQTNNGNNNIAKEIFCKKVISK